MTQVQLQDRIEEKTIEEKVLVKTGLCSTCRHSEACCYLHESEEAILFCEEFEIEKAPASSFIYDTDNVEKLPKIAHLKGLCSNCANAITCTFPKTESGVWHCEEYR